MLLKRLAGVDRAAHGEDNPTSALWENSKSRNMRLVRSVHREPRENDPPPTEKIPANCWLAFLSVGGETRSKTIWRIRGRGVLSPLSRFRVSESYPDDSVEHFTDCDQSVFLAA